MDTIEEKERQIVAEFENFEDWLEKYNYLIEMGKDLPLIDPKYKVKQNLITGCQSSVWLHADYKDGLIFFSADSDAVITKGIVNMLIRVMSGQSPQTIINAKLEFVDEIGLKEHLSPTRSNGLVSMIKQMKLYALAFQAKYGENKEELFRSEINDSAKLRDLVIEALQTIFDPEIPVNIYELGLVYEVKIRDTNKVYILMTLTTPNCPVAESLPAEVREKTQSVPGVAEVEVELTFEPPWDEDLISDEAKLELGLL